MAPHLSALSAPSAIVLFSSWIKSRYRAVTYLKGKNGAVKTNSVFSDKKQIATTIEQLDKRMNPKRPAENHNTQSNQTLRAKLKSYYFQQKEELIRFSIQC